MKPIHINVAESIIEPFWDPEISEFNKWKIEKINTSTVSFDQTWCTASFKWKGTIPGEYAFSVSRDYNNISTRDYDMLIVSAALQKDNILLVETSDNKLTMSRRFICKDGQKHEYELDIVQLENINSLKISIGAKNESNGSGWFNWIGLSNKTLLKKHIDAQNDFDEDTWTKHLKPIDFEPEFKPSYGILLRNDEIERLREKVDRLKKEANDDADIFKEITFEENFYSPETHINEYVNFLKDSRYNRERDTNNYLLKKGENAAVAGIIYKDKILLRLAARYALSLASCDNWDDGFICGFSTSSFNHRCFVQSLCLYECAFILDIAGEMFTLTGRELILRKMAEEGLGNVNYNTWKYEYIFHCNQMAWFSPGRMYAYAVLLQHYPRIEKYMDIALDDVLENINNTIEDDGGYLEGPAYFSCVGRDALLALYIYSRSRSINLKDLIPEKLNATVNFGEAIESTDQFKDFVPICDAGYRIKPSFSDLYKVHLVFMAYFFPESVWPDVYRKHKKRCGMGNNPLVWVFDDKISKKEIKRRPFLKMDITGHISSLRKTNNRYAKLFIIGNKAGAGHGHCDKGSFIYEYNGETFLMDPGICSYDNPLSIELKAPDRHNMLVPYGATEIPYPENPLGADILPSASGDESFVKAEIDLTPGWDGWYKLWKRSIISTSPEELDIIDNFVLEKGKGVVMILNSPLEIELVNDFAIIQGKTGRLFVSIPEGCETEVEFLSHPDTAQNRLMIYKEGMSGELKISMRMENTLKKENMN